MARRATYWWLRSPYASNAYYVWVVGSNGLYYYWSAGNSLGVRPALME